MKKIHCNEIAKGKLNEPCAVNEISVTLRKSWWCDYTIRLLKNHVTFYNIERKKKWFIRFLNTLIYRYLHTIIYDSWFLIFPTLADTLIAICFVSRFNIKKIIILIITKTGISTTIKTIKNTVSMVCFILAKTIT